MIDNFLTYGLYPFCAMMATVFLFGIVIELEKTNKNKEVTNE
jgi:hypothetical protein